MADADADLLALEVTGRLVAPKAVYGRIATDLERLRADNGALRGIHVLSGWVASELLIGLDAEGMAAAQAGAYTA